MKARRILSVVLPLLVTACSGKSEPTVSEPQATTCTFTNPVGPGADPWVVRHNGWYHLVESRDGGIVVYRSKGLTDLKQNGVRVWAPADTGWNRAHIWAPELHFIDGRWYIYYAAGRAGPPFIHQRSGVLESLTDDPQRGYVEKGVLYTGDGPPGSGENIWSIDLTVARLGGRLYAAWSGWEENRATDRTPQHLYIAPMTNPWTIGGPRVKISSPVEPWEVGTQLSLNEGPTFLLNGDQTFIVYSARESWLPDYQLGQLRLRSPGADPLNPTNWVKSGPVFSGTNVVYGVGHASFTTSPDNTENWIVYHAKVSPSPGWDRVIRIQKFGWKPDGSPDFGTPIPSGARLPMPSGECVQN